VRSAARLAGRAPPLTRNPRRQSVSSRSSLRVGSSAAGDERAGGSVGAERPPVRPPVSTNPASRRIWSAWRSVIGATPSCAASSSLARQPLARLEHAGADRLAQAAHDLLDGALGLERRECDVACVDVT